jgi:hypothetical protein
MGSRGTPERTIALRCYAYRRRDGRFYAECIDLDIMVVRDSMREAIDALDDAVIGHVEAAASQGWFDDLVPRRSPPLNQLKYHFCALFCTVLSLFRRDAASCYRKRVSQGADHQPVFA